MALIKELRNKYGDNLELLYVGDRKGMERQMAADEGVPFKGILCGKMRRYFSWENFVDFLKVPVGILQAYLIIKKFRPDVVFCKGGYVSFPAAVGGRMAGVPVVLHESDVVPGLSNKMSARVATKICVAFEESGKYFPAEKVVVTGNPVRKEIVSGDAETGRKFCGFDYDLPVLLVTGGSQGAEFINNIVFDNLTKLLSFYRVAHICGEGKMRTADEILTLLGEDYASLTGRYKAFEFVKDEMKDLYAMCGGVVSRAGAMTLAEIAAVGRPAVLIPLGKGASRGDQIDNARAFCKEHRAVTMDEDGFVFDDFLNVLRELINEKTDGRNKGADFDATGKIINLLESL